MALQPHAQRRRAVARHHIRHDLPGPQGAVAGRLAAVPLEVLQYREIQVLVQRLGRADDLVAIVQPALDAAHRDVDLQGVEIGLRRRPGMSAHGRHRLFEQGFVVGPHRAVVQQLIAPPGPQPADWRALVTQRHEHRPAPAIQTDGDFGIGNERQPGLLAQQAGQGIGIHLDALQQLGRSMNGDLVQILQGPGLLEEEVQQRLVGAAHLHIHSQPLQSALGAAPLLLVLKQPDLGPRGAQRLQAGRQGVKCGRQHKVLDQCCHGLQEGKKNLHSPPPRHRVLGHTGA
ncbi:MAG: hypothetical protein IV092_14335 [Burkholderiaceae bacterium]|nr:hypothetical protein [Burkholderiaceae bacterium]